MNIPIIEDESIEDGVVLIKDRLTGQTLLRVYNIGQEAEAPTYHMPDAYVDRLSQVSHSGTHGHTL